jgi:chemotaxis protein MotB
MSTLPKMGPPPEEKEEGAPDWVVTYGDMMSLLLVFFILIVSFSQMDVIKYRALVGSIRTAFGAKDASFMTGFEGKPTVVTMPRTLRAYTYEDLEEETQQQVRALDVQGDVDVTRSERGVALRIKENLLFDLGKAELRPYAGPLLRKVAKILKNHPYTVMVEGHTDDLPISTPKFPSNWELSAARAAAVVRYLVDSCGMRPEHLVVMGYADTRPVAPNTSPEGRAKNRRVEFLLSRIPLPEALPGP